MPFDGPAYEQAYVQELFNRLLPGAYLEYRNFFYDRTRAPWQLQMDGYVTASEVADPSLPVYERAYVRELYNRLVPGANEAFAQYIMSRTPGYWQTEMTVLITAYNTLDVDVQAWVDSVVAGGSLVSKLMASSVSIYTAAQKASGVWPKMDDAWVLWGDNPRQQLTSLKQRRLGTAVASPTFTTRRHVAFNGTTQYIDTGFIPGTHATVMTPTNARMAIYAASNETGNTFNAGANSGTNRLLRIRSRTATASCAGDPMCGSPSFTLPAASSLRYLAVSQAGGVIAGAKAYKNGVPLVRAVDPTGFGATLPAVSIFIGGYNSTGTLTSPRVCSVGFLSVGGVLSDAEELAAYNATQAFAVAIGANV